MKTYTERLIDLGHCAELGMTYYAATLRRYGQHVAACDSLQCNGIRESFERFAAEIVDAGYGLPEEKRNQIRVSLLKSEPMAEAVPSFQRYPQYVSPIQDGVFIAPSTPKQQRKGRPRPSETPWRESTLKRSVTR